MPVYSLPQLRTLADRFGVDLSQRYAVAKAAKLLGVSERSTWDLIGTGQLPAIRTLRPKRTTVAGADIVERLALSQTPPIPIEPSAPRGAPRKRVLVPRSHQC
jgi:hypothetical protein